MPFIAPLGPISNSRNGLHKRNKCIRTNGDVKVSNPDLGQNDVKISCENNSSFFRKGNEIIEKI